MTSEISGSDLREQPGRVLPPVYFLVSILLMAGLHLLIPGPRWPATIWRWAGGILVVGGATLTVWGARLFRKRGTAIRPFEQSTALVVEGPYRLTRNPMYLGMLLILAGLGLTLCSTMPLLVIPAFVWVITSRFIVVEERMLVARFGDAYENYRRRVRRWI